MRYRLSIRVYMLDEQGVLDVMKNDLYSANRRIDRLERQLNDLVHCAENNSGYVPSLCCYQHAIVESKKLLKEKW